MESHLLQMRGLKPVINKMQADKTVASFTDAWIETFASLQYKIFRLSHLLQMRGLKHLKVDGSVEYGSRIFYRCVD